MKKVMPADSVRGAIRRWIERHADLLGADVLEVGSRIHNPAAWWLDNRDLARGQWTGVDMQPGLNVDQVVDIHALPGEWKGRFSGVLCSEVLEHVRRPWLALPELARVLRPGGVIVVTTLTTFHIHGYPDDYYRYTEAGLCGLLEDAGFVGVETATAGEAVLHLKNHDEQVFHKRAPIQVFAVARVPGSQA